MSIDLFAGLDYEVLMAELGQRLSRISEEATCATWHYRVNDELPQACYDIALSGVAGTFDTTIVSVLEARLLVSLAERLGHWVTRDGGAGWTAYVPEAMKERASRTGHGATKPPTAE